MDWVPYDKIPWELAQPEIAWNPSLFDWLPNAHQYVHLPDSRDQTEYSHWSTSQALKT